MTVTVDHADHEQDHGAKPGRERTRDADNAEDRTRDDVFASVVARLSRQSVDKHFDAYADVDWDGPDMAIDPADPRFRIWSFDPLSSTAWFQAQGPELQSRIGLHRIAAAMRIGWEFENVLQRGLLEYVFWLPSSRPQFRYIHHEIIEECQHTLMFQEFVNRTGLDIRGMPVDMKLGSRFVVRMSRRFPALFFLFVLGGEDPVDHVQRLQLRAGESHPVVERIMRIHVTEEARHVSFARQYLKRSVPRPRARPARHLVGHGPDAVRDHGEGDGLPAAPHRQGLRRPPGRDAPGHAQPREPPAPSGRPGQAARSCASSSAS